MSTKVFKMKRLGTFLNAALIEDNKEVLFEGKYYKLNYPEKAIIPFGDRFEARYFFVGRMVYVNFRYIGHRYWESYWRFAPIEQFEGVNKPISLTKRYI